MIDPLPLDWQERQKALDTGTSCIVQAPAGSGKTELLVQRILALLTCADSPEEILSITFTRKAAGEMQLRLMEALEGAQDDVPPNKKHAVETWQRSRAVLERDKAMGWGLLQNPARLQLMTIDGFCTFLTRRMPWLARFGEQPGVTEHPAEFYARAAENLLAGLETRGPGQAAIEVLLVHLDNRLQLLRDLIVTMLGRRDQWLRHLLANRDEQARNILEAGLQQFVETHLQQVCSQIGKDRYAALWEMVQYAATNLAEMKPEHPLTELMAAEKDPKSLRQWQILSQLVLTSGGEIRKSITKTNGFPAGRDDVASSAKKRMLGLLESLGSDCGVKDALKAVPALPGTVYTPEQWQILEALIELLPLAVVELQNVFRQQGQVDFIEIAGAAHAALGSLMTPEDLLLQLDSRIRHILVDEFQDTSYAQYNLLQILTAGWGQGDGRTLFAVGDPMQSIYRFREAEVGLYLRVCQRGLEGLPLKPIVLNTNFRSRKPLVDWVNSKFKPLFPSAEDEVTGAVGFSDALAFDQSQAADVVTFHCYQNRQDSAEAENVVALIQQAHKSNPGDSIAVLVRSRSHLEAIIPSLKKANLRFQAQDVDCLTDRPVVRDLLSIVRALLHPADRVAWLAMLRAPWCGLRLEDLLLLCGGNPRKTIWELMIATEQQTEMFDNISLDGRSRIERIIPVLDHALAHRGRLSLRSLVESTWLALGGAACADEPDLLDAEQVFELLDEFDADIDIEQLEERLSQLYAAPDPQAGPELQLMTIHKAKGLEFDTVILPGLGRGVRADERALLRWLEHPDYELLLAPIPPVASEENEPTYKAIGQLLKQKNDHETLRLLYVAVTRAKSKLHLLGHVKTNAKGTLNPISRSLLSTIWPSCEDDFISSLVTIETTETSKSSESMLRRLPGDWSLPAVADAPGAKSETMKSASDGGHYRDETFRSRLVEEGRAIGTIVHQWLERIATEGLERWSPEHIPACQSLFMNQLNASGVPQGRLTYCASIIETCLVNALRSERGRWLLTDHHDARCELSLNGVIGGQIIRATIDRTFVDTDGSRWIIDYKNSSPATGESNDVFMNREKDRYLEQITIYRKLVNNLYSDPIRCALYFPLIDGWIEIV